MQKTADLAPTRTGALTFVEEALHWLPAGELDAEETWAQSLKVSERDCVAARPNGQRARVLWSDDNADMREYVRRLLGERFEVEAVADGQAALEAARANPPDLVLSDVMMPRLDGFGLLRELRIDPALSTIPIILLSARAGEESRVEGLSEGADDYIIKPFSARELLARIATHVEMARLRREAAQREQRLYAEAQSSRDRLENVLASINDQFLILDRAWRYVYVNDRVMEMTGLRKEELLGREIWQLFPETVGTIMEHELRRAMTDQTPVHFEYNHRLWDRWFEIRGYPSQEGITAFVTEITRRKQTEIALRRSDATAREHLQELQTIYDTTPVGMGLIDRNLRFVRINERLAEMNGIAAVEHIGKTVREMVPDLADQVEPGKHL